MFRSIAKAVSKRFAKAKGPARRESSSFSPCSEENRISTSENAAITVGRRSEAEKEVLAGGLNEHGTTDEAFIGEVSPCVAKHELPAPALHCNGAAGSASIQDRSQGVLGHEISRCAYLKWEASGKLKGNDSRFWLEAKEELLKLQSVREAEIRRRAYLKWEAAGKPKGADARFWQEATKELQQQRAYLKWEAAGKPKGNDSRFWHEAKEDVCAGK